MRLFKSLAFLLSLLTSFSFASTLLTLNGELRKNDAKTLSIRFKAQEYIISKASLTHTQINLAKETKIGQKIVLMIPTSAVEKVNELN